MRRLRDMWVSHTGRSQSSKQREQVRDVVTLSDRERTALVHDMHECVDALRGESSALKRAAALRDKYLGLSRAGRREFLMLAAAELGIDRERLTDLARGILSDDEDARTAAEGELRLALDTPWSQLLRHFNRLEGGTLFLMELRTDLIRFSRRRPVLVPLERDLERLLRGWFDVGFLELRRITWDSPASLLEHLARYEAVHTVVGWNDLKNRLDTDRRLFACFHPRFPDLPLTFVEVALTRGIPRQIDAVLDQDAPTVDPSQVDTAIFYSISNVEVGLRGIPFGGFVIRGAMRELSKELPHLKTFATISPIPGFRRWLREQDPDAVLDAGERRALTHALGSIPDESLLGLLASDWASDPSAVDSLKGPLMRLCATYLLREQSDGRPLDPVLKFHLSNGARLDQLSWLADRSERAMAQSAGMMAHYVYELDKIEANHEAFVSERRVVASDAVRGLANESKPRRQRGPAEPEAEPVRRTRLRRALARRHG